MALKKFRKNIRQKRFGQWLRVNLRLTVRKSKRFFKNSAFRKVVLNKYGHSLLISSVAALLCVACIGGAHCLAANRNTERLLIKKLTYGEDYDQNVPYFRTLNAIGSSNHICVSVRTATVSNLHDPNVALLGGGINLKIAFYDGSTTELSLQRRYKKNVFDAGSESNFILTLPYGYTPFDISAVSLVLTPAADGTYDDWLCADANVSFLLGGERILLAQDNWTEPKRFGSGKDMVRAADLSDSRAQNTSYQQMKLLFEKLRKLAEHGMKSFSDATIKKDTLSSLGFLNAGALYLDVETVSHERNALLKGNQSENAVLPEEEDLNYNGALSVTLHFNGKLSDGTYTKQYRLDTPGKDDFEFSSSSTFRIDLPEGMCVFDINALTLTTLDKDDAWAPRFIRAYLTLDYEQELEIGRLTDTELEKQYDSPIFYRGYLDDGISFDLREQNAVPSHLQASIEKQYNHTFSAAAKKMYFEKQSFYSRQILFFEQMDKLIAPEKEEK